MSELAICREMPGSIEKILPPLEAALKEAGFGILTRIDFHQKIQEKLGETIPPTVILGACNPRLAFEAYRKTTDVALLIPCNVVVRETAPGRVAVEAMRPTKMLEFLPAVGPQASIAEAEKQLEQAIAKLR